MSEWSNVPVLKTGVPQGTGGSNPSLSAKSNPKGLLFLIKLEYMRRSIIPYSRREAFWNCSHLAVLRMLSVCPKTKAAYKELMDKGSYLPFSAYDVIAGRCGFSVSVHPVFDSITECVEYFTFYINSSFSNEKCKTLKKAQLRAIHESMYQVENKLNTI